MHLQSGAKVSAPARTAGHVMQPRTTSAACVPGPETLTWVYCTCTAQTAAARMYGIAHLIRRGGRCNVD